RATAAPEYEGKGPLTCPATPVNNPRARSVVHGSTPLPWVSTLVARAAATAGEEDKERCRDNTRSTTSWLRSTSGDMRRYHRRPSFRRGAHVCAISAMARAASPPGRG